jgi:hypothetical protein
MLSKAWTHLTTIGAKVSGIFGLKAIFGVHASVALTGLLLLAVWFVCRLLFLCQCVESCDGTKFVKISSRLCNL